MGPSEVRSWDRSLPILANDLIDAGLGSVEVIVEHRLPLTSKRIDAVLASTDPRTGEDSYVVVELKQWGSAESWEGDDQLVAVEGMTRRPHLHPVLQVRGYCDYLADLLGVLESHEGAIKGAAYLHNATEHGIGDLRALRQDERGRMFTGERRGEFIDYLRHHLAPEPGAPAADRFLNSAVRPSRQLLAAAADELKNREQFVLLAEQRLAYELVLHAVEKAQRFDGKEVVIVTGGPGSGKSVIALSLLGELSRQGRTALHATGSRAFTETVKIHAGRGSARLKALFKYFNSFIEAEPNSIEVLICDEAHRIRDKSANRFTPAAKRTGRLQVDELISVARVPVFLRLKPAPAVRRQCAGTETETSVVSSIASTSPGEFSGTWTNSPGPTMRSWSPPLIRSRPCMTTHTSSNGAGRSARSPRPKVAE